MGGKKVVVVGAGPGGYVAAVRAAQLGAEVVLIEKKAIGGTCLNVGCIPTKVLLHSAGLLSSLQSEAKRIGVLVDNPRLDWSALMRRKALTVSRLAAGTLELVKSWGVEYVEGEATLKNSRVVAAGGRVFSADAVIIATGSAPEVPDVPGFDLEDVITSDEALSLERLPDSIAVSGGGVIGMEFASAFASFGARVTVVVTSPEILRGMDPEAAVILRKSLEKKGVTFYTGSAITGVAKTPEGLAITVETPSGAKTLVAEKLLVAKGRRPFTENAGLEALGVAMERGRVLTGAHMETSVKGVYAVGDCVNRYMLAHVASREGEVAAERVMKGDVAAGMDYATTPSAVYTSPEIASVGLTESEAKKKGHKIRVGRFSLTTNGKSVITGDSGGMMKVVADEETEKILGVLMVGGPATDMIAEAALALHFGAAPEDWVHTIHAHPTVSEAIAGAAGNVFGTAVHTPKK
jgi:dihydrolipoamide dehydrogenase